MLLIRKIKKLVDILSNHYDNTDITERCIACSMEWRKPMEDFRILEIGKVSEETEGNPEVANNEGEFSSESTS